MTTDRTIDRLTPDRVDVFTIHRLLIDVLKQQDRQLKHNNRNTTIETQQDRRYADEQKRYYLGLRDTFTYFINC